MLDISGELLEKGRELRMVFNGFDMPLYKEVNPYLMYPYELVKQYGVPIIKRKCLDFNSNWYENAIKALEFIREETKYNINLIIEHMRRLSDYPPLSLERCITIMLNWMIL